MSKTRLEINIENPQLYTTGDTVRGSVQLIVEDQLDLQYLDVELLGIAKSRNHTTNNGSYTTGAETHKLIQLTLRAFPPPEVQGNLSSKRFTLTKGEYAYPFEFTFPDKLHVAQCVQDKKFFHSKYYLLKEKRDTVALVGSFFHQEANPDDYCRVHYSVNAKVGTPLFHFSIKDSVPVFFAPRNSEIVYSLRHLSDRSRNLLDDTDHTFLRVKYSIDDEAKEKKGSFMRLFTSNSVKVPFELRVRFKEECRIDTERGTTCRVLEGGKRLSSLVDLDLLTSFSNDNLLDALGVNRAKSGSTKPPTVKITHVKVKIIQLMRFLGATETYLEEKFEILNQDLDVEVPFSDFERTEDEASELYDRSPSKYQDKVDRRICYRLSLDPSWWDCYIHDIGQSFLTCSIRKNVNLYIRLTLVSTDEPEKEIKIKSTSPVVFLRQEGLEGLVPFLEGENAEPLPEYMPAPPGYESEEEDENKDEKKSKIFSLKKTKS